MIVHNCAQGSEGWHRLRLGIPTASEFHRIITPTGKLSTQAGDYMNRLLAEWALGRPCESVETHWMEHGSDLEPMAAASFEFETGLETEEVGFITTDDGLIGASPDRLIRGHKRGLELKCPSPQVHIGYMLSRGVDERYKPQVQGQMYVCEFELVYIQSYCPPLRTVIVEVPRDEEYITKMRTALDEFTTRMLEARADLERRFGPFERPEPETQKSTADRRAATAAWYEHLRSIGVTVPNQEMN